MSENKEENQKSKTRERREIYIFNPIKGEPCKGQFESSESLTGVRPKSPLTEAMRQESVYGAEVKKRGKIKPRLPSLGRNGGERGRVGSQRKKGGGDERKKKREKERGRVLKK